VIEQKSEEIKEVVRQIPGAVDLYAERTTGSPYLEMTVDRAAADRYGLNVADVEDAIETAIGGKNLTTTIEGRQRFPVRVRYARDFRENPQQLGEVLVTGSNGAQVPLSKVVTLKTTMGPSMISSENGLLRGSVLLNVRGRDVGGFVDQAQRRGCSAGENAAGLLHRVERPVREPDQRAQAAGTGDSLVLLVIFVLLYRTYGSAKEAAHVLLAVPFALTAASSWSRRWD
jgi:Cu(I)/Ag(I) efflux system membrane protein CusA/SilA